MFSTVAGEKKEVKDGRTLPEPVSYTHLSTRSNDGWIGAKTEI